MRSNRLCEIENPRQDASADAVHTITTVYCFRKHAKFEFGVCAVQLICVICVLDAFDAHELIFAVCALDAFETSQGMISVRGSCPR